MSLNGSPGLLLTDSSCFAFYIITQCYFLNVKPADKENDRSSYDKKYQIYRILYQISRHQGATIKEEVACLVELG